MVSDSLCLAYHNTGASVPCTWHFVDLQGVVSASSPSSPEHLKLEMKVRQVDLELCSVLGAPQDWFNDV